MAKLMGLAKTQPRREFQSCRVPGLTGVGLALQTPAILLDRHLPTKPQRAIGFSIGQELKAACGWRATREAVPNTQVAS